MGLEYITLKHKNVIYFAVRKMKLVKLDDNMFELYIFNSNAAY